MRFASRFVRRLVVLCVAVLSGCATRVIPPVAPVNPTTIYLCDYGIHSSLLLPNGDGRFVEYVYGDWDFAALNRTNLFYTAQALFFSPQPALGRRFLRARPGEKFPFPPNKPHDVQPMMVNGDRVTVLVAALDARFYRNRSTALLNDSPNYNFLFVKDQERYGLMNNCNRLTARNLQRLDCKVEGRPILSTFEVEPPGERLRKAGPSKPGRAAAG